MQSTNLKGACKECGADSSLMTSGRCFSCESYKETEMKTKTANHTPGPWKIDGAEITDGKIAIALCSSTQANARLIAAAPELLEVLSLTAYHLQKWVNGDKTDTKYAFDIIEKAKDAIARAEGRE